MTNFKRYADKYECTLIEAFNDRDEPLTAETIARMWKEDTGKDITADELKACRPDDQKQVNYEKSRYND